MPEQEQPIGGKEEEMGREEWQNKVVTKVHYGTTGGFLDFSFEFSDGTRSIEYQSASGAGSPGEFREKKAKIEKWVGRTVEVKRMEGGSGRWEIKDFGI